MACARGRRCPFGISFPGTSPAYPELLPPPVLAPRPGKVGPRGAAGAGGARGPVGSGEAGSPPGGSGELSGFRVM